MHAWKRSEGPCKWTWPSRVLAAFLLLLSQQGWPENHGIAIRYVTGTMIEEIYMVNANIDYLFSAETGKALVHGVPLQFDTRITVKNQRRWFWDRTVSVVLLKYKLQYHPLSRYYLVINMDNGERQQFQNLGDAIDYLGKLKNYPLITRSALNVEPGEHYGLISVKLDIQSLPAPLRPLAYLSPQWHLSSPTYTWEIQP